ncbi:hypothetical protein [Burkholderia vietnamiensis]|uniref:hypothetical protein n=1 Tax=Burkholderia vietnamiensis TaxID=60552 RepID=UPI001BA31762|nr:hypothetical protein [Burkholderia vietnamiensis]
MRSRRRAPDPAAVALRLKRLRQLQRVTQALVVHDCALIDLSQPVIGLRCQYLTGCSDFDPTIQVLPNLDVAIVGAQLNLTHRFHLNLTHPETA